MNRSRRSLAKYARIVARKGSDSAAAESFRREKGGDEDFAQLARLTDFAFREYDRLLAGRRAGKKAVATGR